MTKKHIILAVVLIEVHIFAVKLTTDVFDTVAVELNHYSLSVLHYSFQSLKEIICQSWNGKYEEMR